MYSTLYALRSLVHATMKQCLLCEIKSNVNFMLDTEISGNCGMEVIRVVEAICYQHSPCGELFWH